MVGKWGMSEVVGPMAYIQGAGGFLGDQSSYRSHSEETARLIDQEIRKMLEGCYAEARVLLEKEKGFLEQLSEALLDTETLDREEIEIIFSCSVRKAVAADEKKCRLETGAGRSADTE
jgi:cell division protease FtsH